VRGALQMAGEPIVYCDFNTIFLQVTFSKLPVTFHVFFNGVEDNRLKVLTHSVKIIDISIILFYLGRAMLIR
jgi:hypothetical protein